MIARATKFQDQRLLDSRLPADLSPVEVVVCQILGSPAEVSRGLLVDRFQEYERRVVRGEGDGVRAALLSDHVPSVHVALRQKPPYPVVVAVDAVACLVVVVDECDRFSTDRSPSSFLASRR